MRARVRDLTEGAVLVEYPEAGEQEANGLAIAASRRLASEKPAGFLDSVPGARTLLVLFDPRLLDRERLARGLAREKTPGGAAASRLLTIPVFYGGEAAVDLAELSRAASMEPEEFTRRHAEASYRVAFLGFAPGFAYLTGLPQALSTPRLSTPRTRVPAGAVAIGGEYTGIYPGETPGGWRLIGRAAVRLFDAALDPPALFAPGDRVGFERIGGEEFERRRRALPPPGGREPAGRPVFRAVTAGLWTSVQGAPRYGLGACGVAPGGAMDPQALAHGNALAGNSQDAAALEITLAGPELEVLADAAVVLTGGETDLSWNGRSAEGGTVLDVRAGDTLAIGRVRGGARSYLCVAGGLAHPAPTSLRLAPGDVLVAASGPAAGRPAAPSRSPGAAASGENVVRVLLGPQEDCFEEKGISTFLSSAYRVSSASDRRGVRLEGEKIAHRKSPEIPPEGTALGGIQVPGDGQPIVLGPDRPVTGGYAKIATVLAADFPLVAQAAPGSLLRFAAVPRPPA